MNNQVSQTGFNGEYQDGVLHQYILGNGYRAYNPALQRFTAPDSMSPFGAGGINPYIYCDGDPVNRTDPTGHFLWEMLLTGMMVTDFAGEAAAAGEMIDMGVTAATMTASTAEESVAGTVASADAMTKSPDVSTRSGLRQSFNNEIYPSSDDLGTTSSAPSATSGKVKRRGIADLSRARQGRGVVTEEEPSPAQQRWTWRILPGDSDGYHNLPDAHKEKIDTFVGATQNGRCHPSLDVRNIFGTGKAVSQFKGDTQNTFEVRLQQNSPNAARFVYSYREADPLFEITTRYVGGHKNNLKLTPFNW